MGVRARKMFCIACIPSFSKYKGTRRLDALRQAIE